MSVRLVMFFALLIGHAIADFPLQGPFISVAKNRNRVPPDVPPGQKPCAIWFHCMTAHALIHAGAVWIVTARVEFALAELVLHWLIDFAKCENWTNPHQDQLAHIACKAAYAAIL